MRRREVLAAAGAVALSAAGTAGETMTRPEPLTFVLVHGSWLGGWSWRRVEDRLRAAGHRTFAPTMTGVGERRHLISATVTLQTWVDDILGVFEAEELRDVVLVGHSFGGRVVTGVADRIPERIRQIVFLDSALPVSGRSLLDQMDDAGRAKRLASASASGGVSIPPPSALDLGISDPADRAWVDRRLSPQPLGTNSHALTFQPPIGRGRPVTFIAFTDPVFPASERAVAFARTQADWRMLSMATGHTAMITAPDELARRLIEIGEGDSRA